MRWNNYDERTVVVSVRKPVGTIVNHYNDVIMGSMPSQITSLTIVYSTVYSAADQRKHESSASPAFVQGIHRGPVNFPHKRPVTRKMFPFNGVIMILLGTKPLPWPVYWAKYPGVFQFSTRSFNTWVTGLAHTVKPVCNDHLPNKMYYLCFIEGTNLFLPTISAFWSSSRWPLAT